MNVIPFGLLSAGAVAGGFGNRFMGDGSEDLGGRRRGRAFSSFAGEGTSCCKTIKIIKLINFLTLSC